MKIHTLSHESDLFLYKTKSQVFLIKERKKKTTKMVILHSDLFNEF